MGRSLAVLGVPGVLGGGADIDLGDGERLLLETGFFLLLEDGTNLEGES